MKIRTCVISVCLILMGLLVSSCAGKQTRNNEQVPLPTAPTGIDQIDSFDPQAACQQALEVIKNNPYDQGFFENVFARIINQCESRKSPDNADIIWEHFVIPLKHGGDVPSDLAVTIWNYYFSHDFASLPRGAPVSNYCHELPEIKKELEKEYQLKRVGFAVCKQGSADRHFLNAMYVYNTMWAACHEPG